MRILFVERNARLARLITEALEDEGFAIDHRDRIISGAHELILVDAEDESFKALCALRDQAGSTPLLVLVSRHGFDGPSRARHDIQTLLKPFRMRDLTTRCRALYRRPEPLRAPELLTVADLHG